MRRWGGGGAADWLADGLAGLSCVFVTFQVFVCVCMFRVLYNWLVGPLEDWLVGWVIGWLAWSIWVDRGGA